MRQVNLNITDKETVEDFLVVNIKQREDGTVKLTQSHLADEIINDLRLYNESTKIKSTPTVSSKILQCYPESDDFKNHFTTDQWMLILQRIVARTN